METIKVVAKYYNVWEPPPIPAQRMIYLDKDILPKIQYDAVKFALTCRGKKIGELREWLFVYDCGVDICNGFNLALVGPSQLFNLNM
jgi:hypothetical protein